MRKIGENFPIYSIRLEILKSGKDIIRKENCRPIFLTNMEVKVLSKILAD